MCSGYKHDSDEVAFTYLSIYGRRSYDVVLHRRYGKILRKLRTALFMSMAPQSLGAYKMKAVILL